MQTNVHRTAMPTAAGILSIISGAGHIIGFLALIFVGIFFTVADRRGYSYIPAEMPTTAFFVILAIIVLVFGVIILVGGVYTLQRKHWGLALTAAILAFLPFNLLGLAAIILLALSKREFDLVNIPPQAPPTTPPSPPSQLNLPPPPPASNINPPAA
jgi:hypothetical protein